MRAFFILRPIDSSPLKMPRKPNYRFERNERERVRAEKKAERLRIRQERSDDTKEDLPPEDDVAKED